MHPDDTTGSWPAPWFHPPSRTELVTGHHLRPLRAADAGLPGLPADVALVERNGAGFAYGVFDDEEQAVLGVVLLGPGAAEDPPYDVVVRWTAPSCPSVARVLAEHLPAWVDRAWPFTTWLVVGDGGLEARR